MESSAESPPQPVDKGKARAIAITEQTPLLGRASSSTSSTAAFHGTSTPSTPRRALWHRMLKVFLVSFLFCLLAFTFLALLLYSYATQAKGTPIQEVLNSSLIFHGPSHVDVLHITDTGKIHLLVKGRIGVDAGSILKVHRHPDSDGLWSKVRKSIGRWGIRRLDRVSLQLQPIAISPYYDTLITLGHVEVQPFEVPLAANPPSDKSWLEDISLAVAVVPAQNVSDLMAFVKDSWSSGKFDVRADVDEVTVRGGALGEGGWRGLFQRSISHPRVDVQVPIPPLPGLPQPGKHLPLPSFSQLVTLLSFNITTAKQELSLKARATAIDPFPETISLTTPPLPFTISLPTSGSLIPIASVETRPFDLTHPNITLDIEGHVLPLTTGSSSVLSSFLSRYLSGEANPISISTPIYHGMTVDAEFPAPNPRPSILRNVTIHDMRIKAYGTTFLASGTVNARVVLPKGMNVGLDIFHVLPDVLVFDGEVPDEDGMRTAPPSPELPDPLPENAFGHIRPEDWLDSVSESVPSEGDVGSSFSVVANIVEVPLKVLPGRQREFSNFVSKVLFKTNGAIAGIMGLASVAVNVPGLPMDGEAGSMELSGLPFQGSVRKMVLLRYVATAVALLPFIAAQSPQVQIGNTAIVGRSIPEFSQEFFGGIPFAEPPVGKLRLKNPVLKTRLDIPTFDASNYGPACLQPVSGFLDPSVPVLSEDCLRINVLRTAGVPAGVLLPVMAWVYGGGFDFGDSSIYNASAIVAQSALRGTPVVFVSLNYRLGPLGFPQGQEAHDRGALNLGMKDQLAALEWVQANIGFFGGDKSKVTVFGQSAGSICLSIHFLNSPIQRLARAAIFESGFPATSQNFPAAHREKSWTNFVKDIPQCASTAGSKDTFSCLRSDTIDQATLLQAGALADDQSGELFAWDPTIDGPGGLLPDIPSKLLAKGKFVRLPFIAGTVLDEATTFTPKTITTEDQIRQSLIANFTPSPFGPTVLAKDVETILKLYPDIPALGSPFGTGNETFGLSSQYKRTAAIFGDLSFQSQRRSWIQTLSKAGVKTFGYLFTDPQSSNPVNGVSHASEIPYVYGAPGIFGGTVTPEAIALSRIMVDYWVSFATSLDPNDGKGFPRPVWTQYTPSNQAIMLLNSTGTSMIPDDYRKKQIDFINSNPAVWHHRQNGPCNVNADRTTTTLNPFSWNNLSNMIYIDQPIGTGFSHGVDTVNSTLSAAPPVWTAFQILFESGEFSKFQKREFILATESYGGHYGPAFVTFFNEQNAKIQSGQIQGEEINVSALMINNGWYDPLIQNQAYVDFATNAPGYGQLQSDRVIARLNDAFFRPGGCKDQEEACFAAGDGPTSNTICRTADAFCVDNVFIPAVGNRDSDDLRQTAPASFPPSFYVNFLRLPQTVAKIGAEATYSECPDAPFELFDRTGDDARTLLPQLAALANSGLKILIWAGDADINCNWLGGHASVLAMDWFGKERLNNTPFTNMTINGEAVAAIQNVDNFSFARVFQAGHEVPAFQPAASLEIFRQIINMEQLHSV
ncbi:hypothetical protein EYR40_000458 [Pleurotus pulmonarius]|nr:hypothetical protein EYR40_000458 [Pleurotus pulmonarius]